MNAALALATVNNEILDGLDIFDGEDVEQYLDTLEPEEGDLVTHDGINFYQYGRLVLTLELDPYPEERNREIREFMDREASWPNVWTISDHGNAILIDVWED